ncbi:hypothetical protein AOL_s00081g349 [Orbilia oligospora ATCC 24927]|uniref:AAA+ ATPase domain-containing protein n=1 Tax=Arthrobotrys oligospora (strain ATCC 24927 / CBS 115.81 / DSM 1491) TaxID=756982 RepID=G1XG56_ARTOA|nr:hypothetical protein AOL_s00081g349 [Orbilia oligospora ATCC 24927]EGX48022.1 hypothetical protein AOL_s00081g349 [Orbilia oligospora ATCC 24927]
MVASYKLPESFLSKNVKLLADLDKNTPAFKVTDVTSQDPVEDGTTNKKTDEASSSPPPTPPDSNIWSITSSGYNEIREKAISGLLVDSNGKFDHKNLGLLFDVKTDTANIYGQNLVQYLCKDLGANYMEFNIDDLDKLGLEFYNQHKTEREKREEKKKRIEEGNRERAEKEAAQKAEEEAKEAVRVAEAKTEGDERAEATEGNKIDGQSGNADSKGEENETSNPDKDENNEEENTEDEDDGDGEPDAERGHFAEFYFGTPSRNGEYGNEQMSQRNKRALDALLDTPAILNTIGTDPISTKKQCNGKIPLILFVYGIERMLDMTRGWRFLSRLRDAIRERRKAGVPIFSIFFWTRANSRSCYIRAHKRTSIYKMSYLPDSITNQKVWKLVEGSLNRETNIRALKKALQSRCSYLVDEGVIGGEVEWDLKGMENDDSIMSRNHMSSEELDRIVKLITARTWGKQKVDFEDISEVLNKIEAARRSRESDTKDEVMPELTSEEQDLRRYVIKPDPVTKATVKQFVALSKLKVSKKSSFLFSYFKSPGILLFGPPGTGKTHLCRAIANDSGHTFIALSAAELNGRYVGETEKAISAMFSLARKLHPCILFLDEVDSLFYRRASNDKSWERGALAQYLQEMDGIAAENDSSKAPLVIVATNRPGDLDQAFLRRLPYRVFLTMPSYEERRQILERMVPAENLAEDVNLADIAKHTEGYSGSDLRTLCGQAALAWATELDISTGEAFNEQEFEIKLSMKNFELAFSRTGPSASPKLMESLEKFHKKFQQ